MATADDDRPVGSVSSGFDPRTSGHANSRFFKRPSTWRRFIWAAARRLRAFTCAIACRPTRIYAPERDIPLALRKDAGIDPGVIAWLLGQFPVEPLPMMLLPLNIAELRVFRDDLRERFRRLALPPSRG